MPTLGKGLIDSFKVLGLLSQSVGGRGSRLTNEPFPRLLKACSMEIYAGSGSLKKGPNMDPEWKLPRIEGSYVGGPFVRDPIHFRSILGVPGFGNSQMVGPLF